MPSSSLTPHCSTVLPSRKRTKCMWTCCIQRPVGGMLIGPFEGTAHGRTARYYSPFGNQLLGLEVQVRKGCAQHIGQSSHRFGTAIHPGRGSVVDEVGGDNVACDVEDFLVQQLFVRPANCALLSAASGIRASLLGIGYAGMIALARHRPYRPKCVFLNLLANFKWQTSRTS
jgi:hypothetical protein